MPFCHTRVFGLFVLYSFVFIFIDSLGIFISIYFLFYFFFLAAHGMRCAGSEEIIHQEPLSPMVGT